MEHCEAAPSRVAAHAPSRRRRTAGRRSAAADRTGRTRTTAPPASAAAGRRYRRPPAWPVRGRSARFPAGPCAHTAAAAAGCSRRWRGSAGSSVRAARSTTMPPSQVSPAVARQRARSAPRRRRPAPHRSRSAARRAGARARDRAVCALDRLDRRIHHDLDALRAMVCLEEGRQLGAGDARQHPRPRARSPPPRRRARGRRRRPPARYSRRRSPPAARPGRAPPCSASASAAVRSSSTPARSAPGKLSRRGARAERQDQHVVGQACRRRSARHAACAARSIAGDPGAEPQFDVVAGRRSAPGAAPGFPRRLPLQPGLRQRRPLIGRRSVPRRPG